MMRMGRWCIVWIVIGLVYIKICCYSLIVDINVFMSIRWFILGDFCTRYVFLRSGDKESDDCEYERCARLAGGETGLERLFDDVE
jgi:hypothetical protein